jgi:hypothetical protein
MSKSPEKSHNVDSSTSLSLAKSTDISSDEAETHTASSLQSSPEIDDIVGALGGLRLVPVSKAAEPKITPRPEIMNIEESIEISLSPKEDAPPTEVEKSKAPNKQHEQMIAETIERMQEGVKDGEWEMLYQSDESEVAEEEKDTVIVSKSEKKEATIATILPTQTSSYVDKLKTSMWSAWGRWKGGDE